MDDRTRLVGLVLLGLVGLGAVVGITACALAHVEVPPSLIAAVGTAVGAIAGIMPATNRGGIDELSAYVHESKHEQANALNALALKVERMLAVTETKPPQTKET